MRRLVTWGLWGGCLAGLLLTQCDPASGEREAPLQRFEFLQIRMGVPFRIVLYAPDAPAANEAAGAGYRRIKQLDRILSDYDPDSELMRLCRSSGPGRPVKVSPELFFVLSRSLELSRKTDGAFDVTVGPVVKLWRIARRRKQLPDADDLAAARKLVGYQHVHLDEKAQTVELGKEGMRLDLGGIAKGYAGDEALTVLKAHGIRSALIDGGGDIVVGDPPPGKDGWIIAVEESQEVTRLKNTAVATSGDAYQFLEINGTRYSHIVDPHTGLGLTTPGSVTVIAPDGATADGLASALSVLDPQRGLKLIEHTKGAEVLIVRVTEAGPKTYRSAGFSRFVLNE